MVIGYAAAVYDLFHIGHFVCDIFTEVLPDVVCVMRK